MIFLTIMTFHYELKLFCYLRQHIRRNEDLPKPTCIIQQIARIFRGIIIVLFCIVLGLFFCSFAVFLPMGFFSWCKNEFKLNDYYLILAVCTWAVPSLLYGSGAYKRFSVKN